MTPRITPAKPRRTMHQSNPGVRRRRDSQPSIHLPRSVYLPSIKTGAPDFSRFSLGAKNSSLANSTAPPRRSEARSISSVKSIAVGSSFIGRPIGRIGPISSDRPKQQLAVGFAKRAAIINHPPTKKSLFYHSPQNLTRIGRQLVAVFKHFRSDAKLAVRIPNHNVAIAADTNRTFSLRQPHLPCPRAAKPLSQLIEGKAARVCFRPHHRQAQL